MKPETLHIACDGYSVVADWYEGSHAEILLVLPGYSSSRKRQVDMINAILEQTGTSALSFDYSGHGDSPFELRNTRPAQHFLEVIHVFDWIRQRYPDAKISVMGSSYGGFLAAQLTKYRTFEKLVLKVPAIYKPEAFYDLWSVRLDQIDAYSIMMDKYRTNREALAMHPLFARVAKFEGKTLVIVHDNDEVVPKPTTNAFIKALKADSFVEPNFVHSLGEMVDENRVPRQQLQAYQLKIASWLKAH